MTERNDVRTVSGRGKWIVGLVVLAVVAAMVAFALGRDDLRSTPVEDAVSGRDLTTGVQDPTDSDPGLSAEANRPQGKVAPDSREGRYGAGSPATKRDTPDLNPGTAPELQSSPNTGRNAPADPTARPQRAPDGGLTEGNYRAPTPAAREAAAETGARP